MIKNSHNMRFSHRVLTMRLGAYMRKSHRVSVFGAALVVLLVGGWGDCPILGGFGGLGCRIKRIMGFAWT